MSSLEISEVSLINKASAPAQTVSTHPDLLLCEVQLWKREAALVPLHGGNLLLPGC